MQDAPGTYELAVTIKNREQPTKRLSYHVLVTKEKFAVEHLKLPKDKVDLDEKTLGRWKLEQEQVRQALNNWIKTGGAFDGVIDFATPTADPANPLTFAAQYNERDKLHPNDAGYQVMANAIDLDMITK